MNFFNVVCELAVAENMMAPGNGMVIGSLVSELMIKANLGFGAAMRLQSIFPQAISWMIEYDDHWSYEDGGDYIEDMEE